MINQQFNFETRLAADGSMCKPTSRVAENISPFQVTLFISARGIFRALDHTETDHQPCWIFNPYRHFCLTL